MILSMVAALLLFALINGLLVYSMIKQSDAESLIEFNDILTNSEENSIELWLTFAKEVISPYLTLANRYPDSTDFYKSLVLEHLHHGLYFIYDGKTGNAVMFRSPTGDILPQTANVLEIEDETGKAFVKTLMDKAKTNDLTLTTFLYSKPCQNCAAVERMAKAIYIPEWNWVVSKGGYTERLRKTSDFFSKKFNKSRMILMGNLLGVMLISFLIGLFMIFKQMKSFINPLHALSGYLNGLATQGIRFEEFSLTSASPEIKALVTDLNSLIKNVSALIENVHSSADKVSDLSGACIDMLDIVDYDAKLVGQRTAEMAASSREVIENVSNMAISIEEININFDGLKRLASHIAENTEETKESLSKMYNTMKNDSSAGIVSDLQDVSEGIKHISVDINEAYRRIDEVFTATDTINDHAKQVKAKMVELSLKSKRVEEAHAAIEHTLIDAKESMRSLNDLSANLRDVVDHLIRLNDRTMKIKAIKF